MKLTGSLKGLLLEIASIETVQDAVNGRKVCIVYYDGDEPGGRGLREVEPVALGKSKAGNLVMRAWDREGASHTGYKGDFSDWIRCCLVNLQVRFTMNQDLTIILMETKV
jgi:hypothetical protein